MGIIQGLKDIFINYMLFIFIYLSIYLSTTIFESACRLHVPKLQFF